MIGKRVADAVAKQEDMHLVGVVEVTVDAIRALTSAEDDATVSIAKTNAALGVGALHE